ncbi:MAG: DUF362 domain-containing protein [Acidobacteriota bacterium]|nr:DUF362 domain-containing protein [Acidobacteriota bacterium]
MISRRTLGTIAAGSLLDPLACTRRTPLGTGRPARVCVLRAKSYTVDIENIIVQGLRECRIDVRGKSVLVKPNLVEYSRSSPIHTDPAVLQACIAALEQLGAARVLVGEGPGHRRDTLGMAYDAGYRAAIPNFDSRFTDLNLDDVAETDGFCGERRFYFPKTVLGVDLLVSLAKMKTHHWAGATLSMKNLFGIVPGAIYGWPKNKLHFIGIDRAVTALYRAFPKTIGIVDGVIGMEGNGPIQGRAKQSGVVVVGTDLAAVDRTCCGLMGIDADRIGYLSDNSGSLIEQRGEDPRALAQDYELLPNLRHLRLGS